MFSRIFIERPRLAAVVSLILLLAGGISLANLPVAEYPEIAPPRSSFRRPIPGPVPTWWPRP